MSERVLVEEGENLEPAIDKEEEAAIVADLRRDQRSNPTAHLEDIMEELYGDRNQSRSHDGPPVSTTSERETAERAKQEFLRELTKSCNDELRGQGLSVLESKFTADGFALCFIDSFSMLYAIEASYEDCNKLAQRSNRNVFKRIVGSVCRAALEARDRRIPIVGKG